VIGNMPLVRSFGAIGREHARIATTISREMGARRVSLQYLEKLRLLHATITVVLTVGVLAWAILLWEHGQATAGDVVLVCTLGFTVLHATRDLAVALVDATQHMARLAEAIDVLLQPHELREHPMAVPLVPRGQSIVFANVSFAYPGGTRVFDEFSLRIGAGCRTGLVGPSGSGKSTLLGLVQRFHDLDTGRILIDGQDIAHVTQESLRAAISFVPRTSRCCIGRSWRISAMAVPRRPTARSGRRPRRRDAASSRRCRKDSTPSSATAGHGSPAGSGSAWPLRARC
jgi:ATP-binding cassette subfamily B protein